MLPSEHIAGIRKDYQLAELDESTVGKDPLAFFGKWFIEAETARVNEVNAMTLATVDTELQPHARIVLLKGLEEQGFVFFTNYNSAKGRQIASCPKAALVFFWPELERQVRAEGILEKIPEKESDAYFDSRPEGSRIGAWSSPQSQVIKDRQVLEESFKEYQSRFSDGPIPRPPHWGGYRLKPHKMEFWQGRSSRMHDRIIFTLEKKGWKKLRLAP